MLRCALCAWKKSALSPARAELPIRWSANQQRKASYSSSYLTGKSGFLAAVRSIDIRRHLFNLPSNFICRSSLLCRPYRKVLEETCGNAGALSKLRHCQSVSCRTNSDTQQPNRQYKFHYPNMSKPLVLRLVASSVSIADRAGDIIRDIMKKGDLQIVDKGINDLQTEADRSVQRCILASLQSQYPNVTVIGEEEPTADLDPDWVEQSQSEEVLACESKLPEDLRQVDEKDICVWVDPLDGTNEYTQGLLDHVTVLIGISVKGRSVAGVMHQPYYNYKAGPGSAIGRTIWGIIGIGSFGVNRKILDPGSKIIVTTRSHETEAVRNAIAACNPTEVMRVGGAGHKVLLLIEGMAHAYVFASPGCKKWDTCAPEAVLRALGGKLTDVHGNSYQYHPDVVKQNTGGVLATAFANDHESYLSKMPDEVKKSLPSS